MTFLVPLLLIGMYALIIVLSIKGGDNIPNVEVIDKSGIFQDGLESNKSVKFKRSELTLEEAKNKVINNEDAFILYIPSDIETGGSIEMFSQKKAGNKQNNRQCKLPVRNPKWQSDHHRYRRCKGNNA